MSFRVEEDEEEVIGSDAWKADALYHLNLEADAMTDEEYELMEQQILNK